MLWGAPGSVVCVVNAADERVSATGVLALGVTGGCAGLAVARVAAMALAGRVTGVGVGLSNSTAIVLANTN